MSLSVQNSEKNMPLYFLVTNLMQMQNHS